MWNTFDLSKEPMIRQAESAYGEKDPALDAAVAAILEANDPIPFSEKKALALVHLLNHCPISVDPNNLFVWQIRHGKIMGARLKQRKLALKAAITSQEAKKAEQACAFSAELDFGHIGPDWQYLLERGICGIIEDLGGDRPYDRERVAVYRAIGRCFLRIAEQAEALETPKGQFIAANLRHLAVAPPETMAQAMQLILLFYVIQTHLDTVIVRSLGGLDRLLFPFFRRDLASARFSKEQLAEITRYFFQTISTMKVGANMPFYIGGTDAEGRDATNELTYFLLEQYCALDIYDPKIHVLWHPAMEPALLRQILSMIRDGKNSFVFINTPIASAALEQLGISAEDARRITVYGCYEPAAEGTEVPCTCAGLVNLVKSLEWALEGEREFSSFEEFYREVLAQLEGYTELCMNTITAYEPHFKEICPSLIASPTFRQSRESGVDIYSGGAKYNNSSVVGAGLATLVDSLMAVKKSVFEEKRLTMAELRAVLRANWEQSPDLRRFLQKNYPKFGNNHPEADALATDLYTRFSSWINGRPNGRGGVFRCGMFSVNWRDWMGEKTAATPDGRCAGEPLSKNLAAAAGQDKNGVTAYLNSLLQLDAKNCPDGYVADVVLHHSAAKGEGGMAALESLLTAFMANGGFSVHFNILSPGVLINAQKEPEKYQNLQIRVCGWNARFVDLSKPLQDEFILQASEGE